MDNDFVVGFWTAITIGADGLGVVSYYDVSNASLKVAHCSNLLCTSATTTTVDDSADDVGSYSAITTGIDGLPLISYEAAYAELLKVAHCSNAACVPYVRRR